MTQGMTKAIVEFEVEMRRGIVLNNDRKVSRDVRIAELEVRIGLANDAIRALRNTKDPYIAAQPKERLEAAIERYTIQRDKLVAECRELKIQREGQPKGKTRIGLRTADMNARNT